MQIDDVVWQIINQTHCSFKIKYGLAHPQNRNAELLQK
jgi:hypothetical protein